MPNPLTLDSRVNQPPKDRTTTTAAFSSMITSPRRRGRWALPCNPGGGRGVVGGDIESLSHLEFLHRLLAGPAEDSSPTPQERRVRRGEVPRTDDPEWVRLGFNAQELDRRDIEQLATCDFVRRHGNVNLVGQSGLGKCRILQAVGHAACVQDAACGTRPAPSYSRSSRRPWPMGPRPGSSPNMHGSISS